MSQPPSAKLTYRSDIDGMRAVAVLLVLADHFHTHIAGGFVGVDVFFVISGYLISAAILKEQANGTFSILNFYERRIRRIFPALIAMLLGTSAMAGYFLFPTELIDYARSLLAAIFSVSNLLFWRQDSYFAAPSAFRPLLHTWSLAVEEQFYIFFPVFLMVVRRFARRQLKWWVTAVAITSLIVAIVIIRRDPTAGFFLAPLRAWELLIGTIISQRGLPTVRTALGRNLATFAGFAMILIPAFLYSDTTVFPGIAAVPPCLGAALIIVGGETGSSVVGSILSLRPVVFIGVISYSLYLWHWPVAVFQNLAGMLSPLPPNDRRLKFLLFAVSLALGSLSWWLVERPFRKGRLRPARRPLFVINGIGVGLVASLGLFFLLTRGVPARFSPQALRVASFLDYDSAVPFRAGTCFIDVDQKFSVFRQDKCLAQTPGKKSLLLLGDSHAAELWLGLAQVFPEYSILQATAGACYLLLEDPLDARSGCRELHRFIYADFFEHHHVDAVILALRWRGGTNNISETIAFFEQHGVKVFLVGPSFEYDVPFPRVLATSLRFNQPASIDAHFERSYESYDITMARLASQEWKVHYISFFQDLCSSGCPLYAAPGVPILCDRDHLTSDGAILFARAIRTRHQLELT